jgi:hypothetical protein
MSTNSTVLPPGYRRLSANEQSRATTYGQRSLDAARTNRPTDASRRVDYDANVISPLERILADFGDGRTTYLGDLILKSVGSSDPSSAPLPRAVQAGGYSGRTLHVEWRPAAATSAPPSPARPSASSPPPAAKAAATPPRPAMPTTAKILASAPVTAESAWQQMDDDERRGWLDFATFAADFNRTRGMAAVDPPASAAAEQEDPAMSWAAMTPAEQSAWYDERTYAAAMKIEARQRQQKPMGP